MLGYRDSNAIAEHEKTMKEILQSHAGTFSVIVPRVDSRSPIRFTGARRARKGGGTRSRDIDEKINGEALGTGGRG
jgi:hypothetical protein